MAGSAPPSGSGHSGGGTSSGVAGSSKDSSLPKYIPMEQEDCEDTKETISRLTRADVSVTNTMPFSTQLKLEYRDARIYLNMKFAQY